MQYEMVQCAYVDELLVAAQTTALDGRKTLEKLLNLMWTCFRMTGKDKYILSLVIKE